MVPHRLHYALWATQWLLGVTFAATGVWKLATPVPVLASMIPWAGEVPYAFLVFVAIVDLLGGVGVVAPSLLRVLPGTTVLAAIGCATLQVCAIVFHLGRGEAINTPGNLVFLAMAVFVAWGRAFWVPIPAR